MQHGLRCSKSSSRRSTDLIGGNKTTRHVVKHMLTHVMRVARVSASR